MFTYYFHPFSLFWSPGEIKKREVSWTLTKKLDFHLRVQAIKIKSREVELGSESWTCLLLQLFLNSCATDIVLVTLLRTAVETAISGVH